MVKYMANLILEKGERENGWEEEKRCILFTALFVPFPVL